jgi:hypothetical protein
MPERTVVFQYLEKCGLGLKVCDGGERVETPTILWIAGGRIGRQAVIIPRRGARHDMMDFLAES